MSSLPFAAGVWGFSKAPSVRAMFTPGIWDYQFSAWFLHLPVPSAFSLPGIYPSVYPADCLSCFPAPFAGLSDTLTHTYTHTHMRTHMRISPVISGRLRVGEYKRVDPGCPHEHSPTQFRWHFPPLPVLGSPLWSFPRPRRAALLGKAIHYLGLSG